MNDRRVDVALPLPFMQAFTYRVPDTLPWPERGCRVVAPFGPRRVVGVALGAAVATTAGSAAPAMKDLLDVVDESPLVPPPLLDLAQWLADYYLAPPGECYRLVLPPFGVRASRSRVRLVDPTAVPPPADRPLWSALQAGALPLSALARRLGRDPSAAVARLRRQGLLEVEQDLRTPGFRRLQTARLMPGAESVPLKGRAQQELVRRLSQAGGPAQVAELVRDRPALRGALQRLVELGVVAIAEERTSRALDLGPASTDEARAEPTADQAQALAVLEAAIDGGGFAPFLLRGVTGSGKTEVYFRAIERALGAGRAALLLVPEIALTPLLVRAAAARFGALVSVLHSELSVGERHDHWWRIRDGEARVVVGARSAVFAPLVEPGLVVVDEEHEAAYKQEESPRYHGRDVAVMRARLEGVPVVLGSATPSLESYANALKGKYRVLHLPRRVAERRLPQVEVVDRREILKSGGDPILTPPLLLALETRLVRGEQALLLLNRRGFATSLLCRECGHQAECPNCSVSLTLHQGGRRAVCHYCGHQAPTPKACPACRGEYLRLSGYGTERVFEAVAAALPRARVARLDRDVAARKGAVEGLLRAFEAGELDVLVGTQMIAKGHDFPRVTLVGVIDADVGLGLPDFRAGERTFQLLTQVAGRAGRGEQAGEVILQSHLPDHYALQYACTQDYGAFFERELEFRRTMSYPPVAALVNLVLRGRDPAEAAGHAEALAERLRAEGQGRLRVLGPARAPLARLRQEHRFQVLIKGQRAAIRQALRGALVARFGAARWPGVAVDFDPVTVM